MNKYYHAYARKADVIGPLSKGKASDIRPLSICSSFFIDKPDNYDCITPMSSFQKLSRLHDGRLMKGDPTIISRHDVFRLYYEWKDRFSYTGEKLSMTAHYMAIDACKDSPDLSMIYGEPIAWVVTPQKSFTIYPI